MILSRYNKVLIIVAAGASIIALTVIILLSMGRTPWGPTEVFGFWSGDTLSQNNSQRLFDPYTFTHILHGVGFYLILRFLIPRLSLGARGLMAVSAEAIWEIVENSSVIIERYRAATLSLNYYGDSVVNSVGDIIVAALAFYLAARLPVWVTVSGVILIEIILALIIRDNLSLNILMLIYPI